MKQNPLWQRWQHIRPGQVVLIEAEGAVAWTARRLTDRALELSTALEKFRPGDRVAFQLPNGADWIALFLALQRAHLTAVPLDRTLPRAGCFEMATRSRARALFFHGEWHEIAGGRRSPDCCCVKITSGSGGEAKLVTCRAEHLLADGRQVARTMGIQPGDRNLAAIPLGHSYGLGNLVMPLILQGTAMVTVKEFVPRQLAEAAVRHRVTVLPLVPALFRILAALPAGIELQGVKTAISAGAVLLPDTARAFFERYGIQIHNFYGSSETGGICYDRTGTATLEGRSVGRPLAGVSIILERGRPVVASAAVATRSGRWRLPDSAEWNRRGELVLLGRARREANIGGKKVHPLEVERILRALPGVHDAAVWLLRKGGRDLLAAAVETRLKRTEVEKVLAMRLPTWKCPRFFVVATELPRSARGKLDLRTLEQMVSSVRGD